MKQHLVVLAAMIVTTASTALAQAPDRQHALTAPVGELARELLLSVAPLFVEVERPTHVGLGGPDAPLYGAKFATVAHPAGFPGLCEATVAYVRTPNSLSPNDATAPFDSWPAFKVVGDTTPLPDLWNDAYEKELEAKCRAAGRVLPATSDSFADQVFFVSHSDEGAQAHDAWTAAQSLQVAIKDARGTPAPECANDPNIPLKCVDPASTLQKLDLSQLREVTTQPCPDNPKLSCIAATFFVSAEWNEVSYWVVDLRIEPAIDDAVAMLDNGGTWRAPIVRAIKLRPEVVVYD